MSGEEITSDDVAIDIQNSLSSVRPSVRSPPPLKWMGKVRDAISGGIYRHRGRKATNGRRPIDRVILQRAFIVRRGAAERRGSGTG